MNRAERRAKWQAATSKKNGVWQPAFERIGPQYALGTKGLQTKCNHYVWRKGRWLNIRVVRMSDYSTPRHATTMHAVKEAIVNAAEETP